MTNAATFARKAKRVARRNVARVSYKVRSYAANKVPSRLRIGFVVINGTGMGGTVRAAVTQANALAALPAGHHVTIVSLRQVTDDMHYPTSPNVKVDHLIDLRIPDRPTPVRRGVPGTHRVGALAGQESVLVPRRWDSTFNGFTDAVYREYFSSTKFDVLVTTTPELLAVVAQLLPDTPLVHQEHRASSTRIKDLEALLTFGPRADVLASLTGSEADWLATELRGAAPEMVVVPNALSPAPQPRSPLDQKVFVSAGRLTAEKQFEHTIDAFAMIADELPGWRLRILGEGPHREALLGMARRRGVADRVDFPGLTDRMTEEWAAASVCVLSSRTEGFPLVLQEAMAAGVPAVSYDCPSGPREIVTHEVDGLLVPPNSRIGLADAMFRLASDSEFREELGAAALKASSAYDATDLAERWVDIFGTAIRRRRDPLAPRAVLHGRTQGHLGETQPGRGARQVTPFQARRLCLELLTKIAARVAGDDWFVVPAHTSDEITTVVVPAPLRAAFLDAFVADEPPRWLSLAEPGVHGWAPRRGTVKAMRDELRNTGSLVLRFEPWPWSGGHRGTLSEKSGVALEFWQPDRHGGLVAPQTGRYGNVLPAGTKFVEAEVDGVRVRSVPDMLVPTVDEVTFDVDVVYTWVDGNDPAWRAARTQRLREVDPGALAKESSGDARYRSRNELLWSMRSVHLFAPWVRTIHLVTAGQTPEWLDTSHPQINLVDHRDFLPADALPTFSSHAIESHLHHIPGLADAFVYLNDDVMLGRPLGKEFFFSPAGQYAVFRSVKAFGLPGLEESPYLTSTRTNQALLRETYGVTPTHLMAHSPHPMSRSALQAIEEQFPEDIARTARSPFRAGTDVSLLSSLAQNHGLITGRAFRAPFENAYLELGNQAVENHLTALLKREKDFFCIADSHTSALDDDVVTEILTKTMKEYYPVVPPWEKD